MMDALVELKDLLAEGMDVDEAVESVAADIAMNPTTLRNLATKAFGDLYELGERERTFRQRLTESMKLRMKGELNKLSYEQRRELLHQLLEEDEP